MSTAGRGKDAVRATYAWAFHSAPDAGSLVALQLGQDEAALAWGQGPEPEQVAALPLGLRSLAGRYFPAGRLNALAIETAIAEIEDAVMPWHGKLPPAAHLISNDPAIAELAAWAGMPDEGPWLLTTEAVEQLFSRWAALAQGRPASQDGLPTTGGFSVALLVLREWLHHLSFDGITVHRPATGSQIHDAG